MKAREHVIALPFQLFKSCDAAYFLTRHLRTSSFTAGQFFKLKNARTTFLLHVCMTACWWTDTSTLYKSRSLSVDLHWCIGGKIIYVASPASVLVQFDCLFGFSRHRSSSVWLPVLISSATAQRKHGSSLGYRGRTQTNIVLSRPMHLKHFHSGHTGYDMLGARGKFVWRLAFTLILHPCSRIASQPKTILLRRGWTGNDQCHFCGVKETVVLPPFQFNQREGTYMLV
jgi:hypothetical protein